MNMYNKVQPKQEPITQATKIYVNVDEFFVSFVLLFRIDTKVGEMEAFCVPVGINKGEQDGWQLDSAVLVVGFINVTEG